MFRDFVLDGLAAHGALLFSVCDAVKNGDPRLKVECAISLDTATCAIGWKTIAPVELAQQAMQDLGIEPISPPVRGGRLVRSLPPWALPPPTCLQACRNITARWSGSASRIWPRPSGMIHLGELWAVPA